MEILIVIAILAILFTIGLVTMNPAGQFARARNQQRGFHINAVRNAMKQKEADDRLGGFVCQPQLLGCRRVGTTSLLA